jgi:hypothetical protein
MGGKTCKTMVTQVPKDLNALLNKLGKALESAQYGAMVLIKVLRFEGPTISTEAVTAPAVPVRVVL